MSVRSCSEILLDQLCVNTPVPAPSSRTGPKDGSTSRVMSSRERRQRRDSANAARVLKPRPERRS